MKKAVISCGGSILVRGSEDARYLTRLASVLKECSSSMALAVVTGGGRTARSYIDIGRSCGADEATLDEIGIAATRLNAYLLVSVLKGYAYPRPFLTIDEGLSAMGSFRIVVGGGTHPGHTTDAVSALIAERWGADLLVNLTSVDGAYSSDPEKDLKAERIERMTSSELMRLVGGADRTAGSHSVMDPLAAQVLHRARIGSCIIHGRDLDSFRSCLMGGKFIGTMIEPARGDRDDG